MMDIFDCYCCYCCCCCRRRCTVVDAVVDVVVDVVVIVVVVVADTVSVPAVVPCSCCHWLLVVDAATAFTTDIDADETPDPF